VRHDGEIRSIETGSLLRHPAHPCNTLTCGSAMISILLITKGYHCLGHGFWKAGVGGGWYI